MDSQDTIEVYDQTVKTYQRFRPDLGVNVLYEEHVFYNQTDRTQFLDGLSPFFSLQHENLAVLFSYRTWDHGEVYHLDLEYEGNQGTLGSIIRERMKEKRLFEEREVRMMLRNVVAGLELLSTDSSPDLLFEINPSTVVSHISGVFQLKDCTRSLSNLDEKTHLAYLSPEHLLHIRELASGTEQMHTFDRVKAAVYSLARLALSVLSPSTLNKQMQVKETQAWVRKLGLDSNITEIIEKMLSEDPSQRPELSEIRLAIEQGRDDQRENARDLLQKCIWEDDFEGAKEYLNELMNHDLRYQIRILCCYCGAVIELGLNHENGKSLCQFHYFCSDQCLQSAVSGLPQTDVPSCPLCQKPAPASVPKKKKLVFVRKQPTSQEPDSSVSTKTDISDSERKCASCDAVFSYCATEPWRLQYLGSKYAAKAEIVCSERCMNTGIYIESDHDIGESELEDRFQELIAKFSKLKEDMEQVSLERCMLEIQRRELLEGKVLAHSSHLIEKHNGNRLCHFCRKEIEEVASARWVVCNGKTRCVCAKSCLCAVLHISEGEENPPDSTCPSCLGTIESFRIQEFLRAQSFIECPMRRETDCCLCYKSGNRLQCGHHYCQECVSLESSGGEFLCPECVHEESQSKETP